MTYTVRDAPGVALRVLVGDSVYERALVTIRDGHLRIDFEASDLDSIVLSIEMLAEISAAVERGGK